jgi:hypothetical protein
LHRRRFERDPNGTRRPDLSPIRSGNALPVRATHGKRPRHVAQRHLPRRSDPDQTVYVSYLLG